MNIIARHIGSQTRDELRRHFPRRAWQRTPTARRLAGLPTPVRVERYMRWSATELVRSAAAAIGRSEDRIDGTVFDSARRHGLLVAARYHRLMLALMELIGEAPDLPYSGPVSKLSGIRTVHVRHGNRLLGREDRIREPRHLIVYRVAPDGVVEVLSVVHDRMQMTWAARRAQREAGA